MKRRSSRVAELPPKRYREPSPKETADDLALQHMLRREEFQARDNIGEGVHLAVGELDPKHSLYMDLTNMRIAFMYLDIHM